MLRGIVGDSTFFKILRTYNSTPGLAYGSATTQDFERVAEEVYGSSLSYFLMNGFTEKAFLSIKFIGVTNLREIIFTELI